MAAVTFKSVLAQDVESIFFNLDEFSDTHVIDGQSMTAMVDEMEQIEREKEMKSKMDMTMFLQPGKLARFHSQMRMAVAAASSGE